MAMAKTSVSRLKANKKYNQKNIKHFAIMLNKNTDAELIEKIEEQKSKGGSLNAFFKLAISNELERMRV